MKHKFFSKRGLALVVSVMMCLSAMSTTAWAGSFKDLQDKIDSATDNSLTLEEGYTYDAEKDSGNTTITIDEKFTLDLGGFTIDGKNEANKDSVITVTGNGDLTLQDSSTDKTGTITGGAGKKSWANAPENQRDGGGIYVANGGKVTMAGGNVTGNSATWGGGVMVRGNDSSFTMTGGNVSGNTASDSGGGVYVRDNATLTMSNSSKIDGNTAEKSGGGVFVYSGSDGKGTFNMNGGIISNNSSKKAVVSYNGEPYGGGGVYVKGDFTMTDGKITENNAGTNNNGGASGGGVYVEGGKFTMAGGDIYKNNALGWGEGGGVYGRENATIEMSDGKITENTTGNGNGGGGVRVWNSDFTMNGGTITDNIVNGNSNNISDANDETHKVTINHGTISKDDADKYAVGKATTDAAGNVTVHDADTGWTYNSTGHWHACGDGTSCDAQFDYVAHTFGDGVETKATCTEDGVMTYTCADCGYEKTEPIKATGHDMTVEVIDQEATCEGAGAKHMKCSRCGHKGEPIVIPANGHTKVAIGEGREATCGADGITAGVKCDVCGKVLEAQDTIPATGNHTWGEWGPWSDPDDTNTQTRSHICTVCGATEEQTRTAPTTDDDTDDDPGTTILPEPVPMGEGPATATIADEDVPLAGLVTLAQLLDELYRHEGAPEVHIPDGFPFADHEYAEAICWGLDNALVFHTEAEPLDPDEIVTVGLMREVLTNFVAYRGVEEFTVELAGADDEIVMDLGERLVVFYAQLAEAEAAAETDETEAA